MPNLYVKSQMEKHPKTESHKSESVKPLSIVLPFKELLEFSSSHNEFSLVFDFSRINYHQSDQVLASIVKYAKKDIQSLTVCLDMYNEIYEMNASFKPSMKNAQSLRNEPPTLTNSAFRKDGSILQAIAIAMKYILPRSQNLTHLEFRNISFCTEQIQILGKALEQCTSLQSLSFDNVPLFDTGYAVIIKAIRRMKLSCLKCKSCNITDLSSSTTKMFLNYKAEGRTNKNKKSQQACLRVLDLRYNSFSYRLLLEIGDVLSIVPLKVLDLRYNQLIDSKIAKNMKNVIHGLDVRVNSAKNHGRMYA
ncbi:hypothetical protein TRFO_35263 [Tritrichomonas foetus]|uniref:Leucine Rich Repeat family protein n=1 Tax=Tritrichomonas foetus TaxID=1144522 RepID=A0A1J4JIY8_9EUKA|nr:hypothetical protein TRFO_35263 [Tritrichomonas foetus]|eukprot:OHS98319.1 hypothetical protein TRFO_35263 [Tritrichomonas foetus]